VPLEKQQVGAYAVLVTLPVIRETTRFCLIFRNGPTDERKWIFECRCHLIDCTRDNGKKEGRLKYKHSLAPSFDIAAPNWKSSNHGENAGFSASWDNHSEDEE